MIPTDAPRTGHHPELKAVTLEVPSEGLLVVSYHFYPEFRDSKDFLAFTEPYNCPTLWVSQVEWVLLLRGVSEVEELWGEAQ